MKLKIGIIGYKNHASRLIKLINENRYCNLKAIYHPSKKINHKLSTNKLCDLYSCDAVFISSPNQTHFDYIKILLENFDGYIFCEKPPVGSIYQIEELLKINDSDKQRIYFNFNLRFGYLNDIINNEYYLKKLGEIHYIKIMTGHGLAYKDEYVNSWRADKELNLHSISETVAIHYIDLLKFNYGEICKYFYNPYTVVNKDNSFDTVNISLKFEKINSSIFTSYACPFLNDITIIGTDGIIRISGDRLCLYGPRDIFDSRGYFINPPMIKDILINTEDEYINSLYNSVDYFISHVLKKDNIDIKYFNIGLSSNRFLLEIKI